MTQSHGDKMAAIESLLGFIFYHLDQIPCAMKPTPVKWVSEPSSLDAPPKPRAIMPECNGRCYTCRAFYHAEWVRVMCPPEVTWVATRDMLRRRYRITDIEEALLRLAAHDATLAQAVWATWVEPWPDPRTEPIAFETRKKRSRLALEGLEQVAMLVEGDVLAFGEKVDPIENDIRRLRNEGFTWREIRFQTGASNDKISRVLCGVAGRRACACKKRSDVIG